MKKYIRFLLPIFLAAMLICSTVKVIQILLSYQEGKDSYAALDSYVSISQPDEPDEPIPEDPVPEEISPSKDPMVDFDQLSAINPDIVGWITIPGTDINYPVVQGPDNDYYLNHLFDGTVNAAGCIFLDADNAGDFTDAHSLIYGHHMKNGAMFASLVNYRQASFYQEHPTAILVTRDSAYTIRFFSGYVCDDWSGSWKLDFGEGEFETWLTDIIGRSCFPCQDLPQPQDQIVTLSTCTYEFEDAKFVLHGYIKNEGSPSE